jgi:hypothetical protein
VTFSLASRIGSSPTDLLIASCVYLAVVVCLLLACVPRQSAQNRTMRLLAVYLLYGTCEGLFKRATHYGWYTYPIRFSLFFLLVGYWLTTRRQFAPRQLRPPMVAVLGMYLALAALQVFNPYLPSPFVGLFGWLSDFMFAVLYFLAFDLFRDRRTIRQLLWCTAALGTLSAACCLLEQWIGPDTLMAAYPSYVPLGIFLENGSIRYRPTTLSPYMEVFGIAAMIALIVGKERRSLWLISGIGLCVLASVLHAVRITWITGFLFVGLFVLLDRRRSLAAMPMVAVTIGIAIQIALGLNDMLRLQLASTKTPFETLQNTRLSGLQALPNAVSMYPFGFGVGEASPGLRFVDASEVLRFGSHNYLTELAIQLSVLGPALLLVFSVGIVVLGLHALRRARGRAWHADLSAGIALLATLLFSFLVGGALGSFPGTDYFWLAAGIVGRIAAATKSTTLGRRLTPASQVPWTNPARSIHARTVDSRRRFASRGHA